jgi:hypothetical protein
MAVANPFSETACAILQSSLPPPRRSSRPSVLGPTVPDHFHQVPAPLGHCL